MYSEQLARINDTLWELPRQGRMNVPGRIFATSALIRELKKEETLKQVANVAMLPGIVKYSFAMPDMHWGYGFAIGGVAAFDPEMGIISPGGVGYDINCGVRLLRTSLSRQDISSKLRNVLSEMFRNVPSGVGSKGKLRVGKKAFHHVVTKGTKWAVSAGYGTEEDLEYIEESGCLAGADPSAVSPRAYQRGAAQLGTLGSGNHFAEIQYVKEIYDEPAASRLGLFEGQVTLTLHTGSRGFGHQICDDYIRVMLKAAEKYHIYLPDKQLCCAPIRSPEGRKYLGAMTCAVNYAFANRQIITHWARESFARGMNVPAEVVNMQVVYEVAHNIAKMETHLVDGKEKRLCVHRKGATRAFGPGNPNIPAAYRDIGQPVLIPGDMGRYSYVLVGTADAMEKTFGTTCHGAGRVMSRIKAKKAARGRELTREMEDRGVIVMASSKATIAEEMPEAYKDVAEVVDTVVKAGLSRKVAKLVPLGVVKG